MSGAERYAPLSAFLVTAFIAASFIIIGETPTVGDPAPEVADFYKDNVDALWIGSALIGLGAVALVWFGASLRSHIAAAEGGAGRLASLTYGGTILMAAGITIFAGINAAAANAADEDLPDATLQTINTFDNNMFFTVAAGTLLVYAALAVAILRHGVFPKWLGWLAVLCTVAAVTPAGFFVFLLSGIVFPILALLMFRGQAPAEPAPPPVTTG